MKTKTVKIALEGFGSHLGMEKGCFTVKNRQGQTEKYPLFENLIDEIKIKSGNSLSSGALASCGFWRIDCLFLTQKGRPVAMLRSLDDDSHVKTRICQYEALKNDSNSLSNNSPTFLTKSLSTEQGGIATDLFSVILDTSQQLTPKYY